MKITNCFWNLCDGLMFALFLRSQIQKAHDFICELELNPSTSASAKSLEFSKELKSKRRSEQILSRTENDYDQLGSSGEAKSVPNSVGQPHTGSSAVVDFSDVSLDWGLGKLVSSMPMLRGSCLDSRCLLQERCTNLPDFSSRVLQVTSAAALNSAASAAF